MLQTNILYLLGLNYFKIQNCTQFSKFSNHTDNFGLETFVDEQFFFHPTGLLFNAFEI